MNLRIHVICVLVMFLLLAASASTISVRPVMGAWVSPRKCVLGPVDVTVVSVQFADSGRAGGDESKYKGILQLMNSSFFEESYGRMWLVGRLGSIRLPGRIASYPAIDLWSATDETRKRLVNDITSAVTNRFGLSPGGKIIAVFADKVWPYAWVTEWGIGGTVAVLDDDQNFAVYMHEFGHLLGLPDLYEYLATTSGQDFTHRLDRMGDERSEAGFSSWSRIKLCWISPKEISTLTIAQLPTTVHLGIFDDPTSSIKAVVIRLGDVDSKQSFIVERRKYTTNVFYADESKNSGHGILAYKHDLPYYDGTYQFTITSDPSTSDIAVSPPQQAAQVTSILTAAKNAIDSAWSGNRTEGLKLANTTLQQAWSYYLRWDFSKSLALAKNATALAEKTTIPVSYYRARELIVNASNLANTKPTTQEAIRLYDQGVGALHKALLEFNSKDFDNSAKDVNSAILLFIDAKRIEESALAQRTQQTQLPIQFLSPPILAAFAILVIGVFATIVLTKKRHLENKREGSQSTTDSTLTTMSTFRPMRLASGNYISHYITK